MNSKLSYSPETPQSGQIFLSRVTLKFDRWHQALGITSSPYVNSNWSYGPETAILGFYPRPVLAFWYCRCLRLSVCASVCAVIMSHEFVRALTHHPFKLWSPYLDHRCKRPWLRSLLFWGWLTLTFKVKFNFKVEIYPILSLSVR